MANKEIYKAKDNGALFIQPDGPNTPVHYLGCVNLEDVSVPKGGITLLQCFEDGEFVTKTFFEEAPGPITTTIGEWIGKRASVLETVRPPFGLYAQLRSSGKAGLLGNYDRGFTLNVAKITDQTVTGIARRNEDVAAEQTFAVAALPPLMAYQVNKGYRVSVTETEAINAIVAGDDDCEELLAVADAGYGAAANVIRRASETAQFAATTDPFTTAENIAAIIRVEIDADTTRYIVARGTTDVGNPAEIAYTDNNGTTWTTVNVGAQNGAIFIGPHSLYAIDKSHIWGVTDDGYIYFSDDGGESWTAQESGVIHSNAYNAVYFADELTGMAVGESDIVAITSDGGLTWSAATAPGNTAGLDVVTNNGAFWWVGDDSGSLWYSDDHGSTWTERAGWTGSGSGVVTTVAFMDEYRGFLVRTSGGSSTVLYTFTGGAEWFTVPVPTNSGINHLIICGERLAYAVGEAQGTTGFVLKIQPE